MRAVMALTAVVATGMATLLSCSPALAQLAAFPGAEGVAKFITGGRGGDVYKVTNLNDSGAGSLRNGIQTAPVSGRTIVFDVAGTIQLATSLDFNGKDNITIAGQTAPGGGITLAGHRLRINPLFDDDDVIDPISNVIVQFLRVRPGAASTNADGVWVQTASNIMIDHVTTSWTVDEGISATHDSNNVTVQWSTMTQGIFEHSYGSLLNGGDYTYAHNLYSHNKSRNPRLQQSQDLVMELDFVNNVIYNPQDRFAYGGGEYSVNWVGNYGIRGPGTGDTNHAFARDTATASKFYVEGNLMDNNTDGLVNGVVPALEGDDHDAAMFRQGQSYTQLNARVPLPATNVTSAQQAYVQVLSRVGTTNFRDAHDRDMIRDVMNQQPGYIDHESEWGAYPTLPTGAAPADSNSDGVPDAWALANYGNTTTPLNTTHSASGYTYLETYLHSLTPFAYAPTGTQSHTITTGFGRGADAQVNENGGTSATSSGDGAGATLNALWGGSTGSTNQAIVLKFDLTTIVPGSVNEAQLELTAAEAVAGTHHFKVWGLEHDGTRWDWEESTVQFDSAPGLAFDSNSRTHGIDPRYTADGEPAEKSNQPLDTPGLYSLGEFSTGPIAAGQTVTFDSLNLAVMLNLTAYFEGKPQAGLVTLILEQIHGSGADDVTFFSSEGSAALAPRLVVDAVVAAPPMQLGDFDGDGDVDGGDFLKWQRGESPTPLSQADLNTWRMNFGPGVGAAAAVVPEPATEVWGAALVAAGSMIRRRRSKIQEHAQ
jgi:pectate lyase